MLAEDESKNCIQDDGTVKHCDDGFAQLVFVQPRACRATEVSGRWVYQYTIATATEETWKEGTTKTHSESKTKEWSTSVTAKVKQGWNLGDSEGSVSVGVN